MAIVNVLQIANNLQINAFARDRPAVPRQERQSSSRDREGISPRGEPEIRLGASLSVAGIPVDLLDGRSPRLALVDLASSSSLVRDPSLTG